MTTRKQSDQLWCIKQLHRLAERLPNFLKFCGKISWRCGATTGATQNHLNMLCSIFIPPILLESWWSWCQWSEETLCRSETLAGILPYAKRHSDGAGCECRDITAAAPADLSAGAMQKRERKKEWKQKNKPVLTSGCFLWCMWCGGPAPNLEQWLGEWKCVARHLLQSWYLTTRFRMIGSLIQNLKITLKGLFWEVGGISISQTISSFQNLIRSFLFYTYKCGINLNQLHLLVPFSFVRADEHAHLKEVHLKFAASSEETIFLVGKKKTKKSLLLFF